MTPKTKTASASVDQRAESVTMIPIADVHAAGDNPRRALGDLAELTESIKANGIIEPLVVVAEGHDGYKVVVGHRRRAAGELAGLPWLPCIVRTYSEMARIRTMLVENLQREDLAPLEEAAGYQLLVDQGLSQRQIAEQVGRNQSHISKHLSLLQLPEKAREAVDAGRISKEDGFELTKLAEHPEAIEQALSTRRSGNADVGTFARAIAAELDSKKARNAARERLEAAGHRVIGEAESSWIAGPGYPARTLDQVARVAGKKFDPTKHESLKCAGYFITFEGEAVPACEDYRKHEGKSRTTADREADREVERARKEREQVAERLQQLGARRSKYIALLLAGKLGADARDHVVKQAVHVYEPSYNRVCEWLGIDEPKDYDDHPATFLLRWIDDAPSVRQLQASLAMVLEEAEDRLRFNDARQLDVEEGILFRHHFEFLTFAGYELAPEEQVYLTAPLSEKDRLRAELFGPDGWGKWATGTTHPEGATKECQPTIEERTWDWGREAETPETGHLEYRGACRGCDWRGPVQTMHAGGENAAVEDAHDHAFPGWRELPAITRGARPDNPSKKWAEAAQGRALEAGYPADFVVRRGPIRELRGGIGMRHVPGYSPFGGYAIAVAEGSEREADTTPGAAAPSALGSPELERESLAGDEPAPLTSQVDVGAGEAAGAAPLSSAPSTSVDDSSSGQAAGGVLAPAHSAEVVVGNFDEEELPEPTPCPVCSRLACSHTIEEKASAAAAALLRAKPELPPKRDPKACRECGCHGDCKGGCSWIDVDDVKGLLCSNHELVLA